MRPSRRQRLLRLGCVILLAGLAGGLLISCTNLGYYSQSLWGGLTVLAKRRSVESLLADPSTPPELRARLELARALRDFASTQLGLPDNRSYRRYADLGRSYAVWNVVATPELSIEPVVWCFPIAGCVSYRGYFSQARAERFAESLRRTAHDVDVGGVPAYSTLGWFADPLLSTFLEWAEPDLAALLFHELAHQRLYVEDDTPFNESFATAVELAGVERWLRATSKETELAAFLTSREREEEFSALLLATRERLREAFAGDGPEEEKRRRKQEVFADLQERYSALKAAWGGWGGYDGWFARPLNNARLAAVGAYHELVPGFQALLAANDGDLERFYGEAERISRLTREQRREALAVPTTPGTGGTPAATPEPAAVDPPPGPSYNRG